MMIEEELAIEVTPQGEEIDVVVLGCTVAVDLMHDVPTSLLVVCLCEGRTGPADKWPGSLRG